MVQGIGIVKIHTAFYQFVYYWLFHCLYVDYLSYLR